MSETGLIQARQKAERAVKDMADGPLKVAAFQTILGKLLAEVGSSEEPGRKTGRKPAGPGKEPDTLRGRILGIKGDGFFQSQQTLGDVREALGSRGWHYPQTTLSGAMQALVRQKHLRRERVSIGKKKVWKYSNP